ncbi:MAG: IS200/IS605 family transposase [Chloroflexota bacterium]|nr:IS200/IS605 family transposase [Chloroflexota bacterium]
MEDIQILGHAVWDCNYHIVWIPKYRKKVLYRELRKQVGEVLRELALQKESRVLEGQLMSDHMHMLISVPPE